MKTDRGPMDVRLICFAFVLLACSNTPGPGDAGLADAGAPTPTEPTTYRDPGFVVALEAFTASRGQGTGLDDTCVGEVSLTVQPDGAMSGAGACMSINATAARWEFVFDGAVERGAVSGTVEVTHFSQQTEEMAINGTLLDGTLEVEFDQIWEFNEDTHFLVQGSVIASPAL